MCSRRLSFAFFVVVTLLAATAGCERSGVVGLVSRDGTMDGGARDGGARDGQRIDGQPSFPPTAPNPPRVEAPCPRPALWNTGETLTLRGSCDPDVDELALYVNDTREVRDASCGASGTFELPVALSPGHNEVRVGAINEHGEADGPVTSVYRHDDPVRAPLVRDISQPRAVRDAEFAIDPWDRPVLRPLGASSFGTAELWRGGFGAWSRLGETRLDGSNVRRTPFVLDADGFPVVFHSNQEDGIDKIYVTRFDGTRWQRLPVVHALARQCSCPQRGTLLGRRDPLVVYTHQDEDVVVVETRRWTGSEWRAIDSSRVALGGMRPGALELVHDEAVGTFLGVQRSSTVLVFELSADAWVELGRLEGAPSSGDGGVASSVSLEALFVGSDGQPGLVVDRGGEHATYRWTEGSFEAVGAALPGGGKAQVVRGEDALYLLTLAPDGGPARLLSRTGPSEAWVPLPVQPPWPEPLVSALLRARDGALYTGTADGMRYEIHRFDGDAWSRVATTESLVSCPSTTDARLAPAEDRILASYLQGGQLYLDEWTGAQWIPAAGPVRSKDAWGEVHLARADDARLYVSHQLEDRPEVLRREDAGLVPLGPLPTGERSAALVADGQGPRLATVRSEPGELGTSLRVRAWDGTQWNALGDRLDVLSEEDDSLVDMAFDAAGRLVVTWAENGPRDVFVKRFDGNGWEALGGNLGSTWNGPPQLLLDSTGALLLLRQEGRSFDFAPTVLVWDESAGSWSPRGASPLHEGSIRSLSGRLWHALGRGTGRVYVMVEESFGTPAPFAYLYGWDGMAWVRGAEPVEPARGRARSSGLGTLHGNGRHLYWLSPGGPGRDPDQLSFYGGPQVRSLRP